MGLQYILAFLLIAAVIVFVFRKKFPEKNTVSLPRKSKKTIKKSLVHSSTGLTMDDHYRLDKKKNELELNELLDKVNKKGYEQLSEKEKARLHELSQNI